MLFLQADPNNSAVTVSGGLEVVAHIGELAPAVEVRPTSRRDVDLEPVLHRHRRAASESGWHRRGTPRNLGQKGPCCSTLQCSCPLCKRGTGRCVLRNK